MVLQSITVCREVSRKPVRSVEQKGCRISAGSLRHSKEGKLKVKGKDYASKQSRERVEQHFNPCYIFIFLTFVKYLHHPTTLLFIPINSPLSVTFFVLTGRQPFPRKHVDRVYLQSRKPEVPSGPVGWRITWLFGRTVSGGCCGVRRAGLVIGREIRMNWSHQLHLSVKPSFFFDAICYLSWHGLSWGISSEEALPKILLRASAYSASRWAKDFICWEGRVDDAAFPVVPLFEGRFKIRICGGGAAGSESSWITIAVRTGEPPGASLDFLYQ